MPHPQAHKLQSSVVPAAEVEGKTEGACGAGQSCCLVPLPRSSSGFRWDSLISFFVPELNIALRQRAERPPRSQAPYKTSNKNTLEIGTMIHSNRCVHCHIKQNDNNTHEIAISAALSCNHSVITAFPLLRVTEALHTQQDTQHYYKSVPESTATNQFKHRK